MRCHALAVVVIWAALAGTASGVENWMALNGPAMPSEAPRSECGTLLWHAGSAEAAWAWQGGGVVPPYYGAFAERYEGEFEVCAQVFGFSRLVELHPRLMDMYIWEDVGNEPGDVLCVTVGVDPGPIARWPHISSHRIDLGDGCCTGEVWWAGFWGAWPGSAAVWFVGADIDGPVWGHPMTNVAPGQGFPSGWQDVGPIFGLTTSLFIGAEVIPCVPTADQSMSWGRVKSLYRHP